MIYFRNENGLVYAYESEQDRDRYGEEGLITMTQGEVDAYLDSIVSPAQVPDRVTMRQARLALHAAGLLTAVDTAIDALPEPPKTYARIEWDYSSEVYRNKDFVVMLSGALELTDEQVDDLFIAAAAL